MNLFPYLAFVELLYDVEPFLFLLFIFWEISFYKIKYLKNEVRTFVVLDAEGPDFLDLSVMGRNLDSTTIPRNDEKI